MTVVVVGGGISGLATAHLLAKQGIEVTVLEPGAVGGKIRSQREGGWLLEHGPQGFLDNTKESLELAADLGLEPLRANEAAKKRFLWFRGKLHQVPERPGAFLRSRLLSVGGKLRILREPWIKPVGREETVLEFATRRLGPQAAERLVAAMVAGIYAGDAGQISVNAAFPRLAKLEKEHWSLIRGMRKMRAAGPGPSGTLTSFATGMGAVPEALAVRLNVVHAQAKSIDKDGGRFRVHTGGGDTFDADAVVLAVPAHFAAMLVPEARALAEVPYAAVDVAFLGYAREDVPHDLVGFGFLVAPGEDVRLLGCLWETSIFPHRAPDGHVLFRLVMGGARDPGLADLAPAHVLELAREAIGKTMDVRAEPRLARLVRHPRGIPQYTLGHIERVAAATAVEEKFPGLYFTGNALRGVGFNDCVKEAHTIARRVADRLGGRHES